VRIEHLQAGGYGGWVRLMVTMHGSNARLNQLLHYFHGTGGGGPVTRGVIQTNRMAVFLPDADVMLTGHTHDRGSSRSCAQRMSDCGVPYHDEQIHVRTPGYKDAWGDGFSGLGSRENVGNPKPLGAAWLRLYCECKTLKMEVSRAQ
jgi:hypothetical protein